MASLPIANPVIAFAELAHKGNIGRYLEQLLRLLGHVKTRMPHCRGLRASHWRGGFSLCSMLPAPICGPLTQTGPK
jgi:hypothetical protein